VVRTATPEASTEPTATRLRVNTMSARAHNLGRGPLGIGTHDGVVLGPRGASEVSPLPLEHTHLAAPAPARPLRARWRQLSTLACRQTVRQPEVELGTRKFELK
jgi:hypothetical protein